MAGRHAAAAARSNNKQTDLFLPLLSAMYAFVMPIAIAYFGLSALPQRTARAGREKEKQQKTKIIMSSSSSVVIIKEI